MHFIIVMNDLKQFAQMCSQWTGSSFLLKNLLVNNTEHLKQQGKADVCDQRTPLNHRCFTVCLLFPSVPTIPCGRSYIKCSIGKGPTADKTRPMIMLMPI